MRFIEVFAIFQRIEPTSHLRIEMQLAEAQTNLQQKREDSFITNLLFFCLLSDMLTKVNVIRGLL